MTLDRRHFAAALGAGWSASTSPAASDRVRLGLVGCGGRGRELLRILAQFPDVDVAAVSDVIEPRMQEAATVLTTAARSQRTEQILDYRRILDRRDIDAVVISTSQH